MMWILVTGAGGMVGSHLVEILQTEGKQVLGTYYRPTVDLKELNPNVKLEEMDVRYFQNVQRVLQRFQPEVIYHLAAQSYPTISWKQPQATIETNITGTVNVFEAVKSVRDYKADYDPMVVVACSSAEYGQTLEELAVAGNPYVREDAELKPLHPYGVSKVGQDLLALQYYLNDRIRCVRVRIFNSTGTRKANDVTSDFTRRAVLAKREGTFKIKVGNLSTKRAIMDQRDLIRGLRLLAMKGKPGDVYNICSEKIYEMREIVSIIERELEHDLQCVVDDKLLRPTDEKIIVGDIGKLKRDTGWQQKITMQQTVRDMMDYWYSHV